MVRAREERREERLEAQRVRHNRRVDEARRLAEQREQRERVARERRERRERMRVLHLQVMEQAEQERRERGADREIRIQQNRMRQSCVSARRPIWLQKRPLVFRCGGGFFAACALLRHVALSCLASWCAVVLWLFFPL